MQISYRIKLICGRVSYTMFLSSYNIRMLEAGMKTQKGVFGPEKAKQKCHCTAEIDHGQSQSQ